jgi:hypothetical protein
MTDAAGAQRGCAHSRRRRSGSPDVRLREHRNAVVGIRPAGVRTDGRPMAHDRSPPSERNASSARSVPTPHAVEAASAPSMRALRRTSTGRRIGVRPARAASAGDANAGALGAADERGLRGALADLEYQRIELIRFNLFDNSGTYRSSSKGATVSRDGAEGLGRDAASRRRTRRMTPVGGTGNQLCGGELIRFRNLDGTCNDIRNPRMGATNELFARNVEFEATFPELGRNELARNRHGDRLGLLKPDPQADQPPAFHARAVTSGLVQCRDSACRATRRPRNATTRRPLPSTCSARSGSSS